MPTGLAFKDGALYVIDIGKLIRYDDAEANLDKMPEGKVVYDDMPSYAAHGWKYLVTDKDGWFYIPFGPPFNIGIPPTSVSQIRRVDPKTGNAEIVALGVRNSVGGDIDPRTGKYWFTENARDWLGDNSPSDKLNVINKHCRALRLSLLPPGRHSGSEVRHGAQVLGILAARLQTRRSRRAARHEVLHRQPVPGEYKNAMLITEHGSWKQAQVSRRPDRRRDRGSRRQECQARGFCHWLDQR